MARETVAWEKRPPLPTTHYVHPAIYSDPAILNSYCLARYHDVVDLGSVGARLKRRVVRLGTRSLGIGKHWPL